VPVPCLSERGCAYGAAHCSQTIQTLRVTESSASSYISYVSIWMIPRLFLLSFATQLNFFYYWLYNNAWNTPIIPSKYSKLLSYLSSFTKIKFDWFQVVDLDVYVIFVDVVERLLSWVSFLWLNMPPLDMESSGVISSSISLLILMADIDRDIVGGGEKKFICRPIKNRAS
jgi:hypothetical protein